MQKKWKQKIPRKRFAHFWLFDHDYKKESTRKNWVDKGTEFPEEFKKLCKAEGIQIYSTMSETKSAYAERTIRSLKNLLYRYIEDNGYNYIQNFTHFVTTLNFRRNCSIDLIPKNIKISGFLSILHGKPLREFRKSNSKIGDRVRISKYDLPFRKGYKLQFTQKVFEIVAIAISSRKHPTYTKKDEQEEIIRDKIYQKKLIKVI